MKRLLVGGVLVVAIVGLGYGSWFLLGDPRMQDAVATTDVTVDDTAFLPPVIAVAPGSTVTWSFQDSEAHNVIGEDWGSPTMTSGAFGQQFSRDGTYDYVCTLHPLAMRGRVVVGTG